MRDAIARRSFVRSAFGILLCVTACAPDWTAKQTESNDAAASATPDASDARDGGVDAAQAPVRDATAGSLGDGMVTNAPNDGGADPACNAGALRCDQTHTAVEVCTAASGWQTREACGALCDQGVCVGKCRPGATHCGLAQSVETCDNAGQWAAGVPCPAACVGEGQCTGVCRPGDKQCDPQNALVPQTCSETGSWISGAACANLCSSGTCAGSCVPGTLRCGSNNKPDRCSAMGTWEPQTACPFVCSGSGSCTGECTPGVRDCQQQAPRSCDQNGKWNVAPACANSACSLGSCIGTCAPNTLQCGSAETPQTCDGNGTWQSGTPCPFVCSDSGQCTGQCTPNSVTCSGATLRTCRADGTGYVDKVCAPAATGETASCSDGSCHSACTASPGSCPGSALCWDLSYGCEECVSGYIWRGIPGAPGGDRICISNVNDAAAARTQQIAAENAAGPGLIDPNNHTYGPNTCLPGYVWRNAFSGDGVCVLPAEAQLAAQENEAHASHTRVGTGQ